MKYKSNDNSFLTFLSLVNSCMFLIFEENASTRGWTENQERERKIRINLCRKMIDVSISVVMLYRCIRFDLIQWSLKYLLLFIQMNTEHKTMWIHDKEFVHIVSLVFVSCCRRRLIYYYSLSIAWMICLIFGRSAFKYIQNRFKRNQANQVHIWMSDFMRNENDFHTKIGLVYPIIPNYPNFQGRKDEPKSSKLQEFQTDFTCNFRECIQTKPQTKACIQFQQKCLYVHLMRWHYNFLLCFDKNSTKYSSEKINCSEPAPNTIWKYFHLQALWVLKQNFTAEVFSSELNLTR